MYNMYTLIMIDLCSTFMSSLIQLVRAMFYDTIQTYFYFIYRTWCLYYPHIAHMLWPMQMTLRSIQLFIDRSPIFK